MSRVCTVCSSSSLPAIDAALIAGEGSIRAIAGQFHIGRQSLARHKAEHLPATLAQAHDAAEAARADDLLDMLDTINAKATAILEHHTRDLDLAERALVALGGRFEFACDHNIALRAVAELRRNLELRAQLQGELSNANELELIVTYTDDWRTGAN